MQLAAANSPAYSTDYVIIKPRWVCSSLKDRGVGTARAALKSTVCADVWCVCCRWRPCNTWTTFRDLFSTKISASLINGLGNIRIYKYAMHPPPPPAPYTWDGCKKIEVRGARWQKSTRIHSWGRTRILIVLIFAHGQIHTQISTCVHIHTCTCVYILWRVRTQCTKNTKTISIHTRLYLHCHRRHY